MALQGGTDLLIRLRAEGLAVDRVVDLKRLPGMQEIALAPDGWLVVGAACTMNQVAAHPLIRQLYGLLAQACTSVASYPLRNRATVGGNCCNGSPAADSAPALYCLGAEAEVYGPQGTRRVPIGDFFLAPGRTALGRGEFLTAIWLPPSPLWACGVFRKVGRTKIGDISIASAAVYAWAEPGGGARTRPRWRIALGAVGPTPLRAPEAEAALADDSSPDGIAAAAELAAQAARPIDDLRASAAYRRALVRVLVRRGIEAVLDESERST